MNSSVIAAAKLQQPLRRQLRRPLLGSLALLAVSLVAWSHAGSFVGISGARTGLPANRHAAAGGQPQLTSSLTAMHAEPEKSREEMSDMELLFDKFNNRGGAILAIILLTVIGVVMEKGLEAVGIESVVAGIYVSGIYFVLMLGWTSTYLVRVFTKGTTYAEQLNRYEQAVMVKRLQELDEDEIEALCEDVGISREDINQAMGANAKEGMTQKDAVIELFKSTQVNKNKQDPRDFFGGFNSSGKKPSPFAAAAQTAPATPATPPAAAESVEKQKEPETAGRA